MLLYFTGNDKGLGKEGAHFIGAKLFPNKKLFCCRGWNKQQLVCTENFSLWADDALVLEIFYIICGSFLNLLKLFFFLIVFNLCLQWAGPLKAEAQPAANLPWGVSCQEGSISACSSPHLSICLLLFVSFFDESRSAKHSHSHLLQTSSSSIQKPRGAIWESPNPALRYS